MAKHTAAPWEARIDETATVRDKDGQIAIFTYLKTVTGGRRDSDEVAANARLAAAAPELLKAGQEALDLLERIIEGKEWGAIEEYADDLRKAIAKATGQCLKVEE